MKLDKNYCHEPPSFLNPPKTSKTAGKPKKLETKISEKPMFLFSWIGPFPMVPAVNPIQLDMQNPNLRSKSLENFRKTNILGDEIFRETDFF